MLLDEAKEILKLNGYLLEDTEGFDDLNWIKQNDNYYNMLSAIDSFDILRAKTRGVSLKGENAYHLIIPVKTGNDVRMFKATIKPQNDEVKTVVVDGSNENVKHNLTHQMSTYSFDEWRDVFADVVHTIEELL